jgi:hypothetical protein
VDEDEWQSISTFFFEEEGIWTAEPLIFGQ